MTEDQKWKIDLVQGAMEDGTAAQAADPISDWERSFMEDQFKRIEEWGERCRFSDKQWAIVERIYNKVVF